MVVIGGLYTYPNGRNIWNSIDVKAGIPFYIIGWLPPNEPFVLLELSKQDSFKVLTTQGIVGWVDYSDEVPLKEVDISLSL